MIKKQSVFDRKWQLEISRNIAVWHSYLTCYLPYIEPSYKYFGLPIFFQLRLHQGTHSDFYYPVDSEKYNRQQFARALFKRYSQKRFLSTLRPKYKKLLDRLLKMANNLQSTTKSLEDFFAYYAYCIPTLDITAMGSKIVSEHLEELLKNNPYKQDIISYYGKMNGAPPMQKLNREILELHKKKFDLQKEAKRLYKKYYWMPANFVGETWGLNDFVDKIKNFNYSDEEKIIKPKIKVSREIKYWCKCLGEIAYLNEFRKSYFTRVNVIIRDIFNKLAQDNNLGSWREMNLLTSEEILDLVRGNNSYQSKTIKERQKNYCIFYNANKKSIGFLTPTEVKKFIQIYQLNNENVSEVKGVVANKGFISGIVKIILTPEDFSKLQVGEILVVKMTSTDFIPIMKRAGAFITDEGGLACHAAIVAREYNKPCIIGTKIGTKVFKDGDLVEVNTDTGIVKKIK